MAKVCTQGFAIKGTRHVVAGGSVLDDDDPIVKRFPSFFRDADSKPPQPKK